MGLNDLVTSFVAVFLEETERVGNGDDGNAESGVDCR